jgi:MSHA biogenesis protein MshP
MRLASAQAPMKLTRNQQGSALVLAVFIMVVVMLLGASLIKILSTSSETIAQEVLGTRALAAANSAMQGQMQVLFPLNNAVGSCPASTGYSFVAIDGLKSCTASVSCDNYVTHNSINYYRLKSTGTCGTGTMAADSNAVVLSSRTVQVEARSLN